MGGVEFDVDYYKLHPDYDPVTLVMFQMEYNGRRKC